LGLSKIKIEERVNKVRIYGAGGHSQVIKAVLESNNYEVVKIFDDKLSKDHCESEKIAAGLRGNIDNFPYDGEPIIIALGDNAQRAEIAGLLSSEFGKAIHYSAVIAPNVKINEGSVVFAGAIIQPNSVIGKHVIINTGASIDHDNVISDFVHISPKVALCGNVEVGEGSHIGVGAVVIPSVKIGKWCTIGAGAVVLKDVPDYSTVVGNPGKVIKVNKP